MITEIIIRDNQDTSIPYLSALYAFRNGTRFIFKPGVNIIVGENGSGKSTLLKLIEHYLMVDCDDCSVGMYNCNVTRLMGIKREVPTGVDVYADYTKNTFRLCHTGTKNKDDILKDVDAFGTHFEQMHSSTGEGVNIALGALFKRMFSKDAQLSFDYDSLCERYPSYGDYVKKHKVSTEDEWTVLMDEPDRNLDITNIISIKNILSIHKEHTQIIAVIHNPLLICSLSKLRAINFIELTHGYINNVKEVVNKLTK